MVDSDVVLGEGVRIFDPKLVNIYGCTIGERSFVGPFVEITRGTTIGKRCIIESHAFICDGTTLEDDVFVGHGVMFVNDLYPQVDRQVERLRTHIERSASIGSNATIVGGITIGTYAVIGAGAVVTRSVPAYAIAAGNPARILRQFASPEEIRTYMVRRQPTKEKP